MYCSLCGNGRKSAIHNNTHDVITIDDDDDDDDDDRDKEEATALPTLPISMLDRRPRTPLIALTGIPESTGPLISRKKWKFEAILDHEGPLKPSDCRWKGSKYNLLIRWEKKEETWEPACEIADDQCPWRLPQTCQGKQFSER